MKQGNLLSFFKRKNNVDDEEEASTSGLDSSINVNKHFKGNSESALSSEVNHPHPQDIANFLNSGSVSDKIKIIETLWIPPPSYTFPLIDRFKDKKFKLRFQHKWLTEFNWLCYSAKEQGAFCKFCAFIGITRGVGGQTLGALVNVKMDNWKKAKEIFVAHESARYHKDCICAYENLEKIQKGVQEEVIDLLDEKRKEQAKQNRNKTRPIIEAIILCGRQEMSLRGHRDSGALEIDDSSKNEGNFREILKYRAKGDTQLRETLEIINKAEAFAILVDETTDISTVEQVSICVRYVSDNNNINEDFLQFIPADSLTGENLSNTILNSLESFGMDISYLVGQGYDGAEKFNEVQKFIRQRYPKAIYIHCAAHSLNLAISKACEVQQIRNCLGVIEKLYTFFNTPKRKNVLLSKIEESNEHSSAKSLKRLCASRWISKYEAV
ncbi:zinc finger MYM-type protein 1-like [Anthonomus grandis grandis]|uniref:zinc finger MYM-type protein 1-like n=1 Tax=Anthonomus grandis grandis TaxID=2921223 RepID=UPI002165DB3D|nr:zinc finger MYM-type protein 1-like [Anthonomus grandis grandis]